jgi:hypothetical protein
MSDNWPSDAELREASFDQMLEPYRVRIAEIRTELRLPTPIERLAMALCRITRRMSP